MSESSELSYIASEAEEVWLPNRYQQPFIDGYEALTSKEVPEMSGRKLTVVSNDVTYRWARGRDIPSVLDSMVRQGSGARSIGFTGSEWWREFYVSQPDRSVSCSSCDEESLGSVALIASCDSNIPNISSRLFGGGSGEEPVSVVTAYPNMVSWLGRMTGFNLAVQLAVSGGAEGVAEALGVPAVDLVSTGETIAENGFQVVEYLYRSYPLLISAASRTPNSCFETNDEGE